MSIYAFSHRLRCAGNLLVEEDYNVRVADFGLSRVKQDLQTMTGGLGTFQWMAPEVGRRSQRLVLLLGTSCPWCKGGVRIHLNILCCYLMGFGF